LAGAEEQLTGTSDGAQRLALLADRRLRQLAQVRTSVREVRRLYASYGI
jgi:hypothetical protein